MNIKKHGSAAVALGLALIGTTASHAAGPCGPASEVTSAAVADFPTTTLADGRSLRIAGIESFSVLDGGDDADRALQARLRELVERAPIGVLLLSDEPDRYGRFPALLQRPGNAATLQEILAGEGLAVALGTDLPGPCVAAVLAAEAQARRAGRGLWAGRTLQNSDPAALAASRGRLSIFEGRVVSVGNRRSKTYLNFGKWWARDVTVEIDSRDRASFGGESALSRLSGQRIRVRGFVEESAGPMVRVTSPAQIENVELEVAREGTGP